MAIFTKIAAIVVKALVLTGTKAAIATALIKGALLVGTSLLMNAVLRPGRNANNQGGRVQLPPSTNNKLPVLYGTGFLNGVITDAKISTDQKTMWYVVAMAEVPDNATMTFNEIYYDGNLVNFGANGNVVSTTNTAGETDDKMNGKLTINLFTDGSFSGTNTAGQSAIQILSNTQIPANQRWNSPLYTSNGQSPVMHKTAFAVVRIQYDADAGLTSLGTITAKMTCSITKPGDAFLDYMTNDRYGCALPLSQIDTQSLTDLNTYSDQLVEFTPMGGGPLQTQPKYRFNGPIFTAKTCLENLQLMAEACDSWLQYNEMFARWKVVMNKGFDELPNAVTVPQLFHITSNNLVTGITVNPSDLNQTPNQIQIQYPNVNIRDQFDFVNIDLQDELPELLSPNEPVNRINLQSELINNYVHAKFIGIRKLLQGREDLVISCSCDYSAMNVVAGDVVRVTHAEYGWDNKLFRVTQTIEETEEDGNIRVQLTMTEYSPTIYDNNIDITDFVPSLNTGLSNPNIIGPVTAPVAEVISSSSINTLQITGFVPTEGNILFLDFNYGVGDNPATHTLYRRVGNSDGLPLTPTQSYIIDANDVPIQGEMYWSVTARNMMTGRTSPSSNLVIFDGVGISNPVVTSVCNVSSVGTLFTTDPITDPIVGGQVSITTGTGQLQPNTRVTNVLSSTEFTVDKAPVVDLDDACINIQVGGIPGGTLGPGVITGDNIANGTITPDKLTGVIGGVDVQNDGNIVTSNASFINFTGSGVTATGNTVGSTVNISGYYQGLGIATFQVADTDADIVTLPVNVTSTSTRNIPVFIPGTNPGSNKLYPYFQGTSSTTDGFVTNSTGIMTPADSATMELEDGDNNWYRVLRAFSSRAIPAGEILFFNYYLQLVSDTDNTKIQIAYGMGPTSQPFDIIYTPTVTTLTLDANLPVWHDVVRNTQVVGDRETNSGGVWVRNLTPGSNVYLLLGQLIIRSST